MATPEEPNDVKQREAAFKQWRIRLSKSIGAEVQRLRADRHMTVTELSRLCGIPRMTLNNIEQGHREGLTVAELLILAAALNVPPTVLLVPPGVSEVEATPGSMVPVEAVVAWLGDPASDVAWISEAGFVSDSPQVRRVPDAQRVRRLLNHHRFLAAYRAARPESSDSMNMWSLLFNVRQQMRDAGEFLPRLPAEVDEREREEAENVEAAYNDYLSMADGDR